MYYTQLLIGANEGVASPIMFAVILYNVRRVFENV